MMMRVIQAMAERSSHGQEYFRPRQEIAPQVSRKSDKEKFETISFLVWRKTNPKDRAPKRLRHLYEKVGVRPVVVVGLV